MCAEEGGEQGVGAPPEEKEGAEDEGGGEAVEDAAGAMNCVLGGEALVFYKRR